MDLGPPKKTGNILGKQGRSQEERYSIQNLFIIYEEMHTEREEEQLTDEMKAKTFTEKKNKRKQKLKW